MDCPQCGRNGYMPGKACGSCGYLATGTGVPEEPSEDMPLDELNRMLGELGIEPITDVVRRTGPEPVPSAENVQGEDTGVSTSLESVQVEDMDVSTPLESGQVENADVSAPLESVQVEGADILAPLENVLAKKPDVPFQSEDLPFQSEDLPFQSEDVPMETPVDEIELSGEDVYRRDVPEDESPEGKALPAATEVAPFDAVEDFPAAVRQTTQPKKRLRDVRHKAGPGMAAANFFRALAGWLPALFAGAMKAVKKQPSVTKTMREAAVADSLPSEGERLSPETTVPAVTQEPEPLLSSQDEGDALLRELLSQGIGETTPAGNEGEDATGSGTDPSAGDTFEEPVIVVAGEKSKIGTGRDVKTRERKKPEPMSPRAKNLIFWIAVPLALVVMVAGLLRFVLVLRDRSLAADEPKGAEEWHYVPWSPEADIPPTSVTIEATENAFVP